MNRDLDRLTLLPQRERTIAFEETAERLDTLPSYIEKDYWVRLILDFLFNRLPLGHPMDIVVSREEFGFAGESDPTGRGHLSNRWRKALFSALK